MSAYDIYLRQGNVEPSNITLRDPLQFFGVAHLDAGLYTLDIEPVDFRVIEVEAVSYLLAGQDLSPLANYRLTADGASYAQTGGSLNIYRPHKSIDIYLRQGDASPNNIILRNPAYFQGFVRLDPGSFGLTIEPIDFHANHVVSADPLIFSLSLQSPPIFSGRHMVAGHGSFSYSGYSVRITKSISMLPGMFALSGQSAVIKHQLRMSMGAGSFVLAGQSLAMTKTMLLSAGAGSFVLAGQSTRLAADRKIAGGQGAFALTGQSLGIMTAKRITLGQGSYSVVGHSMQPLRQLNLSPNAGSYSLTIDFVDHYSVSLMAGSFTLAGESIDLALPRHLHIASITITGLLGAELTIAPILSHTAGSVTPIVNDQQIAVAA